MNNRKSTPKKKISGKKFIDLLSDSKLDKDDKKSEVSHTSFGKPWGKYYVPDEKADEFISLYTTLLRNGTSMHFVERPKFIAPLCIDIDFKFESVYPKRNYTADNIRSLIKRINDRIVKYINVTDDDLISYVFEKPHATHVEKHNQYKDGFHIIYPFIAMNKNMRYFIIDTARQDVVTHKDFAEIPFCNDIDDVFDTSVVMRNGWMMYGSVKENGQLYSLTSIYDHDVKEYSAKKVNKIINSSKTSATLSVRKFNKEDEQSLLDITKELDFTKRMKMILEKYEGNKIKKLKKQIKKNSLVKLVDSSSVNDDYKLIDSDDDEDDNIDIDSDDEDDRPKKKISKEQTVCVKKLVNLLSVNRAKTFEHWIYLGWCLKNISYKLLPVWIEFSKKDPKQYEEGMCEKKWSEAYDGEMGMGTLHYWAKADNPTGYTNMLRDKVKDILKEAESGTHYDIAKVICEMYRHQFRCISMKKNVWYEFQNHRWVLIEDGYTLNNIISEELTVEFLHLNKLYVSEAITKVGGDRDLCNKKSEKILKIIQELKKSGFKKSVMEQCSHLFYEKDFEEKLNKNRDILGFDNGVYDLKAKCFRAGLPDDYLTFSVGYNYKEYSHDHKYVKNVAGFFRKVQPENDMYDYVLTLLASHLDGWNKQQRFVFFTGHAGCHAKGTKIIMYDGKYKNVEDVKINDKLMGDNSTPRIVSQLFTGTDLMYRIIPVKGDPYIVNQNHVMSLKSTNTLGITWLTKANGYVVQWHSKINNEIKRKTKTFSVVTHGTKQKAHENALLYKQSLKDDPNIIKNGDVIDMKLCDYIKKKTYIGERNYFIYKTGIEFDEKNVDVDSYLLGYWLGDGASASSRITTMDEPVINKIRTTVENYGLQFNKVGNTQYSYDITTGEQSKKGANKVRTFLYKNNLINNKHIPNNYKFNSRNVQLNVLAGIIDSDGYYSKDYNQYEITLKSEKLIDDIIYMCRSLGFSCYKKECQKTCTNSKNGPVTGTYYQTIIVGENITDIPCVLDRKKSRDRIKNKDTSKISFKIEEIGNDKFYGFELDQNHRYLTSDFIVHHNSNGKSTALDFLQMAMGDYASSVPPTLLTRKEKDASSATPELADKNGVRFLQMDEPEGDDHIFVSKLKRLSGNDKIAARALYQDLFYYKPQFKMILVCNKLPHIEAIDGGTWRRIRVTPWESRFIDLDEKIEDKVHEHYKDPDIENKMDKWKRAFMWLLIHKYYPIYRKAGGVPEPNKIKKQSDEYQKSSDVYFEFMSENLEITGKKSDWEKTNEIYDNFKTWYKSSYNGGSMPLLKDFRSYITTSKYKNQLIDTGSRITGLKIKLDDDDDFENRLDQLDQ